MHPHFPKSPLAVRFCILQLVNVCWVWGRPQNTSCYFWPNFTKDVPVNHPVLGICRVSHYPVLSGPGKIIDPSKFFFQSKILKQDGVGYQSWTQRVTTVFNRSQNPFKSIERVG